MPNAPDDDVSVERHPAERLARVAVIGSVCCSSCCCCCCCVHAIGGVVGAALGSATAIKKADTDDAAEGARRATAAYWFGFCVVSALVLVLGFLGDSPIGTALVVVFAAPFFQLLAAPIALVVASTQAPGRRAGGYRATRNIALGTVVGAFAGTLVMIGLGVVAAAVSVLL